MYRGKIPDQSKKYGLLTPIKPIGHKRYGKSNRYFYLWACDCGKEKEYPVKEVLNGKCKSCGCLSYRQNPRGWTKSRNPALSSWKVLYKRYRSSAKHRNYLFSLSLDYFITECSKNCFYCNEKPRSFNKWNEPNVAKKSRLFSEQEKLLYSIEANGIDRIDSNLGYFVGNVKACCRKCNLSKSDMSISEFITHIERIHEWQHQKE